MYVLRGFDSTTPSFMMPIPSLLALPSKPIATTIVAELGESLTFGIYFRLIVFVLQPRIRFMQEEEHCH